MTERLHGCKIVCESLLQRTSPVQVTAEIFWKFLTLLLAQWVLHVQKISLAP